MPEPIREPNVRLLNPLEVVRLRGQYAPGGVNLGNASFDAKVNDALERARAGSQTYLVEWEGGKIPRGASIDGVPIGWTQNGMVSGAAGEQIGTYERLLEHGGASGQEHKMLIYTG